MTKSGNQWYAVDKEGLRMVLERRGIEHALLELFQNADDTDATIITVGLVPVPNRPLCELTVIDNDPEGFKDLDHAFTLFAESQKKSDPTKAGRFNLGEKLVLALCVNAEITSTTGTVTFAENGERWVSTKERREKGTRFRALIRMTREGYEATRRAMHAVLVRPDLEVRFNGERLLSRPVLHTFSATLTTEIGAPGEALRRSARKTTVRLYRTEPGEVARLYELSCPVVETGDTWHIQVMQRVPLNLERDNVSPAFLRELRVAVLNAVEGSPDLSDAVDEAWVTEAAGDPRVSEGVVSNVLTGRYGERRVSADPSDREAERTAVSKGYVVVQPLSLPPGLRKRAKETGELVPAGRVFPSPKPFSADPNAPKLKVVAPSEWSTGMRRIEAYAKALGEKLLGVEMLVVYANDLTWPYSATYGRDRKSRVLTFNVGRLGRAFFEKPLSDPALGELLLHELGHEFGDHLEASYHEGLCGLGAKLCRLALTEPGLWNAS